MTEDAKMTVEQAIRLLDPATTAEAIAEIEYFHGFNGRTAAVQAISDASELACKIMREHEQVKWERDAAVEDLWGVYERAFTTTKVKSYAAASLKNALTA